MLVLSRRKDQEIMMGDDIKITVLEIEDGVVKIGIDAPRELIILRAELYQAVEDENKSAVVSDQGALESLFEKLR